MLRSVSERLCTRAGQGLLEGPGMVSVVVVVVVVVAIVSTSSRGVGRTVEEVVAPAPARALDRAMMRLVVSSLDHR